MYIYLDLITTGYNYKRKDEVLQIAIIDDKEQVLLNTYCKPRRIRKWNNGITREMVTNAPHFDELKQQIIDICKGNIIVTYYADFIVGFLSPDILYSSNGICCCQSCYAYRGEFYNPVRIETAAEHLTGKPYHSFYNLSAIEYCRLCRDIWRFSINYIGIWWNNPQCITALNKKIEQLHSEQTRKTNNVKQK